MCWRALTINGRWQLIDIPDDYRDDPAGNVAVWQDRTGTLRVHAITEAQPQMPVEHRLMPHAATCAARRPVLVPAPRHPADDDTGDVAEWEPPGNVIPFVSRRPRAGHSS
ncbi:hypothetical protein [Nonomuraea salmonea]|uniref:Uncharacterized protein n=1 Tax=Nonomuraea salmonea TaxID=46181 RepID=A0ABV5P2Z0_9ACTN